MHIHIYGYWPRDSSVWNYFKYLKEDDKSVCLVADCGHSLTDGSLEREILLRQNKT